MLEDRETPQLDRDALAAQLRQNCLRLTWLITTSKFINYRFGDSTGWTNIRKIPTEKSTSNFALFLLYGERKNPHFGEKYRG